MKKTTKKGGETYKFVWLQVYKSNIFDNIIERN